jgi:hypothetical protein
VALGSGPAWGGVRSAGVGGDEGALKARVWRGVRGDGAFHLGDGDGTRETVVVAGESRWRSTSAGGSGGGARGVVGGVTSRVMRLASGDSGGGVVGVVSHGTERSGSSESESESDVPRMPAGFLVSKAVGSRMFLAHAWSPRWN